MRLLQLQFGCIFAGDHPLVMIDIIGHAVEKSGFAGARPPEIRTLQRTRPMILRISPPSGEMAPKWIN